MAQESDLPHTIDIHGPSWRTPASTIPDQTVGQAEVRTFFYKEGDMYELCGTVPNARYYQVVGGPLPVKELMIGGKTVMVDDPPHHFGMLEHGQHYEGTVLVAGLGLGLILHALEANLNVERMVVVERSPDVVALITPQLVELKKYEVILADWDDESWRAGVGQPDGLFFDLFVGDGRALLPAAVREMITMRERFSSAKTVRIHGFPNDFLWELSEVSRRAGNRPLQGE